MKNNPSHYRAYLLRLWKTPSVGTDGQGGEWHASLEELHTRTPLAFATVERLFAFLLDQIDQQDEEF
jgi:hypothetical protein